MPVELVNGPPEDAGVAEAEDAGVAHFDLSDDGESAAIHLSRPVGATGSNVVTMKRPKAGQWIAARGASKGDEEAYARLIAFATGLSYGTVANLDLGDYMKLKEAVEALAGF